jgi:hypothetical protein
MVTSTTAEYIRKFILTVNSLGTSYLNTAQTKHTPREDAVLDSKIVLSAGTSKKIQHIGTSEICPGTLEVKKEDQIFTKAYYNYTECPTLLSPKGLPRISTR